MEGGEEREAYCSWVRDRKVPLIGIAVRGILVGIIEAPASRGRVDGRH